MTKISYLRKLAAEKYSAGRFAEAAKIGEILLAEHWHNKNFQTDGYSADLFNLACYHDELGNLERAATLYSDSAAQISFAQGESLPLAERLNNLATVLIRIGIPEPAFFMLGNAADIRRRLLGTSHPLYADSLYNLGNAAAEIGRKEDSLRYHREALEIRENEGHTEDIVHSLVSISFLHKANAEYDEAIQFADSAIRFAVTCDESYAGINSYLAELFVACKKYEDALPVYDRALETIASAVGRNHSAYMNVALRRASALSRLNRHREALVAHEEVLEIFDRVSSTKHAFYANCLREISMLHHRLGEPSLAVDTLLEATKIRRRLMEDITQDMAFLIRLHLGENQPEKALEALVYALMCAPGEKELPALIGSIAATFNDNSEIREEFMDTIVRLNNRELLRPILQKWEEWEKS